MISKRLSKLRVNVLMVLSLTRMTVHLALQGSVCIVENQNIHMTNALQEIQNALSVIRRGTTVACVCLRDPLHQFPQYKLLSRQISETDSDENFLVTVESQQETQWTTLLKVNDVEVKCKIYTRAEVSAATFKHLQDIQLKKPTRLLYGPATAPLTILGQFTANLTFKHITCKQTVFVVKDLNCLDCLQSHLLTSFQESTQFIAVLMKSKSFTLTCFKD